MLLLTNYMYPCSCMTFYSSNEQSRLSPEYCVRSRLGQGTPLVSCLKKWPTLFRTIIYYDRTVNDPVAFTTDNALTTHATRSDLATGLCNSKRVPHWATATLSRKTPSLHTAVLEPAATTKKETDPSFMVRIMAAYTVKKANEDSAGPVVLKDHEDTE